MERITSQHVWDCRWSHLGYRVPRTGDADKPESLWSCMRKPGIRRPVTERECETCPFWEPGWSKGAC